MSVQEQSDLVASDLPITLYLNQRLTFDLLAVLRGGFSSFSTVQTSSSGEISTDRQGKAQLGVSNVFALLGVNLSAQGSQKEGKMESHNKTEEIVHTPASLFAQLRRELHDRNLVRSVSSTSPVDGVHPSDFVEFEATLRRSPLIDLLDAFSTLMPLIGQIESGVSSKTSRDRGGQQGRNRRVSDKNREYATIKKQIDGIKSLVTAEGSQDFIAEMPNLRVVLTTEQDYFVDPSMNDIIDGTFRVFGKATRVITNDVESISLFRKTAAGKFDGVEEALGGAVEGLQSSGFGGSIVTEIPGPTMQVVPIAIFS